MKILLINSVCGVGSTGKICTQIANLAKEQGHECVIAFGRNEAKGYDNVYRIESSLGNKFHFLKSRLFDKHGLGSVQATKRFIKFIEEHNPDVVHLHNIHGYYLNYKILFEYLKTYKGKLLWTLHDEWAFTGHCACLGGCKKWLEDCKKCEGLSKYPKAILNNAKSNFKLKKELFTSVQNMTILTPSRWLKDLASNSFLSKYEIKVINNGVDLEIFKQNENNFKKKYGLEDRCVLLGVSFVWVKEKGFDDFIELSKRLDNRFKIVLVGVSDQQLNSLPNNIIGIKRTNNAKELAEIYSSADLFVNFTYDDNFPTVNIEALACGTPVLTYKTGGAYEMVDESCGFVVETGDIDKATEIIKNYKKTEGLSINAIKKSKEYDKNKLFLEYLKLYDCN